MLERLKKYGIVGLMVMGLVTLLAKCSTQPKPLGKSPVVLLPNEAARLILSPHTLITVTPKGATTQYVPPDSTTTISVGKDGKVTTHVQTFGVTVKLGGGIGYADKLRFDLDLQLAYAGRFGGHIGCGFSKSPLLLPFVAGSYRLDQIKLPNTSLLIGKTIGNQAWIFGIRTEF